MEIMSYTEFMKHHSKHSRNHSFNLSIFGYMHLYEGELDTKEKSKDFVNSVINLYKDENGGNRFSSYVYYRTVTNGWRTPYILVYGKE